MDENNLKGEFVLRAISGPMARRKFVIKGAITAGSRADSDIKIEAAGLEPGKEAFRIEKISEVYILRSSLKRGVLVSGEETSEKILEPRDRIEAFGYRFVFEGESAFISVMQETLRLDELGEVFAKNTIWFIGIAVLLFLVLIMPHYRRTALSSPKAAPVAKQCYSQAQLVDLIADARRKYASAVLLYQDSDREGGNLLIAAVELWTVLSTFEDVEPKPQIYSEAKEMFDKIRAEMESRRKYLKNNAYVAYKLGRKDALRGILIQIMDTIADPMNEDYIWAKKKLLGLSETKEK